MSDLKTTEFVFIRLDELNDMRADLRALDSLRSKWDAIPWDDFEYCVNVADRAAPNLSTVKAFNWLAANAPKEQP